MTTDVDNCNRALIRIGSQRTISSLSQDSVEARACNAVYITLRNDLLRMAPWNCALKTANLVYITSTPGTPENTSPATLNWQRGQPTPPWNYEYQYPKDCLRTCWIIPSAQDLGSTGIPITTAVTGGAPTSWYGWRPINYKVATDQFYPATRITLISGGVGYLPEEILTLTGGPDGEQPWGGPAQVRVVTTNSGTGEILTCQLVSQVPNNYPLSGTPLAGSYFITDYTNIFGVASIQPSIDNPSNGFGATFTLGWDSPISQRVILTNQQSATLVYVQQVIDPDVWDNLFQRAFQCALGAELAAVLTNDKNLPTRLLAEANAAIIEARKADGNEGLTINDVTPDWIQIRGTNFTEANYDNGFNWGGLLGGLN